MSKKKPLEIDIIELIVRSIITLVLFGACVGYLYFVAVENNCKTELGGILTYLAMFILFAFAMWCLGVELIRSAVVEFPKLVKSYFESKKNSDPKP